MAIQFYNSIPHILKANVFLVTHISDSFGKSVLKIATSQHMLTIIFVTNVSYHYQCSFIAHDNTQNAHTTLQLLYTYSFFVLCAQFQVVRTPTEFCPSLSGLLHVVKARLKC